MLDPRIPFKNRWLAGVLAFLLPGAGHIYQGRRFKGLVCGTCILATFLFGMYLGDWGVVYWKTDPTNFLNPYYAQFFVGIPALPALVQSRRYLDRDNAEQVQLDGPLNAPFRGSVTIEERAIEIPEGSVAGAIALEPHPESPDASVRGEFTGTLTRADGNTVPIVLRLGHAIQLGKAVSADRQRSLETSIVDGSGRVLGRLAGGIPQSPLNWFEAPPDEDSLLELHRKLGKFHELAMTFTMIAGLLNILVILDVVEGPAYGYGDVEPEPESGGEPTAGTGGKRPPKPESASGADRPPAGTPPQP